MVAMVALISAITFEAFANPSVQVPVIGKITLLVISSEHCDTCERLAPVINELKKDYLGKIALVEVDFWKNAEVVNRVATNTAPTVILYDKVGTEIFRGYGVITKEELQVQLRKAGVK